MPLNSKWYSPSGFPIWEYAAFILKVEEEEASSTTLLSIYPTARRHQRNSLS
jgi:hypothetical protein